jgi:hypothetical protein
MPRFPKGSQEAKDYMASIRAKKGSGMGSCSGGSVVSGNTGASAPPPPPPPPPRPSLPPPIDTSFSINQSLINAIEEILMSSSLPEERRLVLVAELRKLKDRVNDAGVAKASTAKPSGAGMKGKGSGASMSLQTQLTRLMRERDVIVGVMTSLQARMDNVMTAPGGGSFDERVRSLGAVSREMNTLVQRLSRVNTEINAIEDVLFPEDDGGDTESESSMEGSGVLSSILSLLRGKKDRVAPFVPSNTIQDVEVREYDDRVGSTERIPSAVAVGDVAPPFASSATMNEVPIRNQIKDLQKRLKETTRVKKLTETRMKNTLRFSGKSASYYQDEDLLGRINEDIEDLTSLIEELVGELNLDPNTAFVISGRGMKKKQKN